MSRPADRHPPPFDPAAIRGVVFDLDGTLVDSYAPIAASLDHARAAFGLPPLPPALVRRSVGRGLEALVADLVGPGRVERGVAAFREHYARVFREQTTALPGVRTTLAELHRRGYRLAVASNKPARFSEAILERLGLRGAIVTVAGPDVVGSTKPDPRMIRHCLERLGLAPGEALYVGDMVLDAESAARAGVAVLLVEGGSSTGDELRATGAPVVGRIEELCAALPHRPRPAPCPPG